MNSTKRRVLFFTVDEYFAGKIPIGKVDFKLVRREEDLVPAILAEREIDLLETMLALK